MAGGRGLHHRRHRLLGRMVFMAEGGLSLDSRPHAAAWRDRLMAMPGFALPYDLIPKKDAEFG